MAIEIKTGWGTDETGSLFAPKTLVESIQNAEGKTLQELLDEKGSGTQSDWIEEDITSDAYIKNKPLDLVHISDNKEAISVGSEITVSPFKFGIDENGNYGYYKDGADTVTPFKVMSDIELLMDTSPISSASSYITGASVLDGKEFVDYDFLNFIISVTINGKTTSYNNYFAPIVAGFNPTFIKVQAHVPYELTFTATHPTLKAVYYSGNYYITTLKIEGAKNCNPFKNGRG